MPDPPWRGWAAGYCAATSGPSDCAAGDMGSWLLSAAEAVTLKAAAAACVRKCRACSRCKYVSVSAAWNDCSWFHECALERLQTFKVPMAWQEQVDLFALTIRARPAHDDDELQPSCFRCQTINPLLNPQGDRCTACGHPFLRSFVNFEHLPLVRFIPMRDVTPVECLQLLLGQRELVLHRLDLCEQLRIRRLAPRKAARGIELHMEIFDFVLEGLLPRHPRRRLSPWAWG